ncbi:Rad17 cell cycle checkpoint protein-domain-containing protein [Jimgerdemannia flammicorona]|uniref:Rad17 cell cycle checkpoint protein-domain-containing protein n=1 Tax=Jimgerdemannia flammicorona TaxID=994334 RepID=A0A433QNV6_9FUNG|nr:Rad17 cell cycle checkpoint protein-domain-containing protein [Jimgerdemannia flammicorona]
MTEKFRCAQACDPAENDVGYLLVYKLSAVILENLDVEPGEVLSVGKETEARSSQAYPRASKRKTTNDHLIPIDSDSEPEKEPAIPPKPKRPRKTLDTINVIVDTDVNFTTTTSKPKACKRTAKQPDNSAGGPKRTRSKVALTLSSAVSFDSDSDLDFEFQQGIPVPKKRTVSSRTPAKQAKAKEKLSSQATLGRNPALTGQAITKSQWLIPSFYEENSVKTQNVSSKAFEKAKAEPADSLLWVDKHVPHTEDEIAVNKKKIAEVRNWFNDTFAPTYRSTIYQPSERLLILTGPAGSGKTAVLRMLSMEMNFEIIEWSNPYNENSLTGGAKGDDEDGRDREDYIPVLRKFQEFISRANKYPSLIMSSSSLSDHTTTVTDVFLPLSPPTSGQRPPPSPRKVILIEDIPNISSPPVKTLFHSILRAFLRSPRCRYPIVLIISDATIRNTSDADGTGASTATSFARRREQESLADVRTVVPPDVLNAPGCRRVQFNPIAVTFMIKALSQTAAAEFGPGARPGREYLEEVAEASNGDVRSALNTLQFLSLAGGVGGGMADTGQAGRRGVKVAGRKKSREAVRGNKRKRTRDADEEDVGELHSGRSVSGVGGRESSLALFHALGKILYNKRIGDSGEEQDSRQENMISLCPLPEHMLVHRRPSMKSNPEHVLDNVPVDPDIFTLYLHQNYLSFMTEVEECAVASDWFSTADHLVGLGGWENTTNTSYYANLLSTRGLMFSHTCPVSRQQKVYRPEYWNVSRTLREAQGGVKDVTEHLKALNLAKGEDTGWRGHHGDVSLKTEMLPYLSVVNKRQAQRNVREMHPVLMSLNNNHFSFLQTLTSYTTSRDQRFGAQSLGEKDDNATVIDEMEEGMLEKMRIEDKHDRDRSAGMGEAGRRQQQEALLLHEDDIEDF